MRNAVSSTAAAAGAGAARAGCARAPRGLPPVPAALAASPPAAAGDPAASSSTITLPSLTLSPTLTFTSRTVPAAGAGTSMVALSDSSVTRGSSAFTTAPGWTKTSMTGTSLKSPMSGTLTVMTPAGPATAAGAGGGGAAAGALAFGAGAAAARRGLRAAAGGRFERQQRTALADLVADLDLELRDRARGGRGHVHGRLVRLERDQRVLGLDAVAGLDQDLDDRHILEVTDVGNLDLDCAHRGLLVSPRGTRRPRQLPLVYKPSGFARRVVGQTVHGAGFVASMPYFLSASATLLAGNAPSSASAFSAATVT